MSGLEDRMSRAEQRLDALHYSLDEVKADHRRRSDSIQDTLEEIKDKLSKQSGFFAGVSASVAFAFAVISYIIQGKFIH